MRGWQNQYEIAQKMNREDDYFQRIKYFEKNEYQTTTGVKDLLEYNFPQSECFSLGQLIESLNCNFIKIYKGQLLILILEVLKHLYYLHQQTISHGRLIPQNIVIKLKNDKNKLTIIQTKFTIQQVYFINYRLIDDCEYLINYQEDVKQIIDCFILIMKAFQDQKCELLNLISTIFNEYKNNKEEHYFKQMIEFFKQLINDCVDFDKQKLKKDSINLSINLNDPNTQLIKYQEGEEYGLLSKRQRTQTLIENFFENLNQQSITCKQQQNKNYDNTEIVQIFDIYNLNEDEFKIFNVFQQIIKQQMMKIIWNQLGAFLESWENDFDFKCNAILENINKTNQLILNNQLKLVLEEYKNVHQINKQIQDEIEKNYKFEIKYDEQRAKDTFIQELKVQAQHYSFNNFQSFINTIKSNVKQELSNYYKQIVMIEIINLQFDVI